MALLPTNSRQIPDHAIMDFYNKQVYLGNQYVAGTGVVSLSDTAETPLLYLLNPAANANVVGSPVGIFNSIRRLSCSDITGSVIFRLYSTPVTVTSGSTVTPINCRLASANASLATCKKSVAAVSNGTLISALAVGFETVDQSEAMIVLDPGSSILITAQAVGSATTVFAEMIWYEI